MSTSFNTNDDPIQNVIVQHDYYTAVLYTHMFNHTALNGGYLKIPYYMPNSIIRPNLQYTENATTQKYQANNLYIFKKTHKIIDVDYDAELVIENKNVNNSDKIYTCFLLKNKRFSRDSDNAINILLKKSQKPHITYDNMVFKLNPLIEKQSKIIQYKSNGDVVLIFTNPIIINDTDFDGYKNIPESLMQLYPSNNHKYKIIKILSDTSNMDTPLGTSNVSKTEGFQEGYDIMDCQMVDEKGVTKGNNTMTKLMTTNSKENDMMMVGNLFTLFVLIISGWLVSPSVYKYIVIEHHTDTTFPSIFIGILIFILGLFLFIDGMQFDKIESIIGMLMLIFLGVSIASIILKRTDETFIKNSAGVITTFDGATPFSTFIQGFKPMLERIIDLFTKFGVGKYSPFKYIGIAPLIAILIILVSVISFVAIKKDKDVKRKDKKQKGYTKNLIGIVMSFGILYGIMLIIYGFHLYPPPQ